MNGRKLRWAGCLLLLLLMVGLPCLLVWRERRRERLSAQLIATLKDLQSIAEINYEAEEDKDGRQLANLKKQVLEEESRAVSLLQAGADPDVRDFATVKRPFWEEVKFLLKRMLRRPPASTALPPSALAMAVQANDAVIVTALLKAGANDVNAEIETRGGDLRFPLVNYGAYNGNLEIVQGLCAHGADIHKLSPQYVPPGESILHTALAGSNLYPYMHAVMDVSDEINRKRRTEIFHLLLTRGMKYEPKSKDGYGLLREAADGDFLEITRELLSAGVPPYAKAAWLDDPVEFSPLDAASNNDDIVLAKLLLQYGASTRDPQSDSPMLFVKSIEMARFLLEHGADLHAMYMHGKYSGQNALNYACTEGNSKLAAFLIAQGLSVNSGGEYACAINQAAEYGNVETVRVLLEHRAKVGPHSRGAEALYLAIAEQRFESARLILRYGAAVNPPPSSLATMMGYPLSEATAQDSIEMVLELLKRGANVNADHGEALLEACDSCDEDLVEILLEHGANPKGLLSNGLTAIQTAKKNADPSSDADGIVALLKDYGETWQRR